MFERSGWQKFVGFRGKPGDTLNIFIRYLTAVEDYTARELRFGQDSLNAFAGIIKKNSKGLVSQSPSYGAFRLRSSAEN